MDELVKMLESSDDKLSILKDMKVISDNKLTFHDYFSLIDRYLNSSEIMDLLTDETVSQHLNKYRVLDFLKKSGDELILDAIHSKELRTKYDVKDFDLSDLLETLSEQVTAEVLGEKDFVNGELKIQNYKIAKLIEKLPDENVKIGFAKEYGLESFQIVDMVSRFSQEGKEKFLLSGEKLYRLDMHTLIGSMEVQSMVSFISKHNEFFTENKLSVFDITMHLEPEKQKEFIEHIEKTGLDLNEKRKIFASLSQVTKTK